MGLWWNKKEDTVEIDLTNNTVASGDIVRFSNVKEDTATKIVALNSGINLIANAISTLPIYLYKRNENGERKKVEDFRNYLLNASPNDTTVASNLKYSVVKNLILKGNSFVYIRRDKTGKIQGLELIDGNSISIEKALYNNGEVGFTYRFKDLRGNTITAENYEVINILKDSKDSSSPWGRGVLETGKELINIAVAESKFTFSSLEGVNLKGFLSTASKLSREAKENLKESWRKFYSGSDKNATPVLEEGLVYNQLNLKPADIELIKNKEFTTKQIALLLNIPFSYLVDSASSYNNSQEESLRFLKQTLNPYIRLIEENFNKLLLTELEKREGYFFEFNTSELLKVSATEQIDFLDKAIKSGLMTLSEGRRKLNLPYMEGTDILLVPLNMATVKEGKINSITDKN